MEQEGVPARQRRAPSAHTSAFQQLLDRLDLDEDSLLNFRRLVERPEIKFSVLSPPLPTGTPVNGKPRAVCWGTMNVNSVYGREHNICHVILKHNISFLAVTEPMLRANDPPRGLFKNTFSEINPRSTAKSPSRRGLLWIPHPDWQRFARRAPYLPSGNPHILWIEVTDGELLWLAACVYLPQDSVTSSNDIVAQLLSDVEKIPPSSRVLVTGDFNADPFKNKGFNLHAFRRLMSSPRLTLVPRPDESCYTRPAGKSHVDNFLVANAPWANLAGPIEYLHIGDRARIPSDHLLIMIRFPATTNGGGKPRKPREKPESQRYDTTPLLNGGSAQYTSTLTNLSQLWLQVVMDQRDSLAESKAPVTDALIEAAYEGLKFILYSAAFQSLRPAHRAANPRQGGAGRLSTEVLLKFPVSESWSIVRRKLRAQESIKGTAPFAKLEQDMTTQGQKRPQSTSRSTRQ